MTARAESDALSGSMAAKYPIPFGRYQLLQRLAIGGMAELFRAQSTGAHGFERTVVIKRILPHLAADERFTGMFINEAKITAQLVHPKIAQTYELGREGDQLFIAMEYVDGLDALALLRELAHQQQAFPAPLAVYVVQEIADALDFAHKQCDAQGRSLGIVHRDVSPSNVLMSTRGDVKLVDFGIAQAVQQEHHTKSGTLKGKYGYMSPEQVVGSRVTPKSDLFAAGIVLAEMLMGRRLFAAPNELDVLLMVRDVHLGRLDRFGGDIPPDLMAIVKQCLRKDPDERFLDAAELRDALGDWLYNTRKRIGAKDVADLVNKYLDQARFRQAELLRQSGTTTDVSLRADDEGGLPIGAAPSASSSLDIEITEIEAVDEAAGAYEEAVDTEALLAESVALQYDDAVPELREVAEPAAADTLPVAVASPGPDPASAKKDDDFFDLGDLDDVDLKPASERESSKMAPLPTAPDVQVEPPVPAAAQVATESAASAPASGPLPKRRVSATVQSPPDLSHYDSIEAAVASLALPDPDPSAKDFDDRDVTEAPRPSIKKQMRERPPAEAVLEPATPQAPGPRLKRISSAPAETGSFTDTPAMRILYLRTARKSTGLLVVESGTTRKEIYFVDGKPEFVSSNVQSELFGNYLVAEGIISGGELDMALAMIPHYQGKLGDTLVGLGLVRPLDVFRHLTRQVRRKLIDVCTWQAGSYQWFPDRLNTSEAFPLDLDAYEVLGAGALELTPMFLQGWIDEHKHEIPRRLAGQVPMDKFQVSELQMEHDRIDGESTLMELLTRIRDPRERGRFVRSLYLFLSSDYATFEPA